MESSPEAELVLSKVSTGTILAEVQANRAAFAKERTVVSTIIIKSLS